MDKVFLVHGWSVNSTDTYQALHVQLAKYGFNLEEIFLGAYVSLENKVEVPDIARAMHFALEEKLAGNWNQPFHFITHSTGALVVRKWITEHYKNEAAQAKGLKNVIFLAGPQFGSRLAHHGRSMLATAVFVGDTGTKVLEALELGSRFSWENNAAWLNEENWKTKGIRPYCLIGDRVKKGVGNWFGEKIFPANFEEGSDMVVRVPAGNLNHKRFRVQANRDNKTGAISTNFTQVGELKNIPFAALAEYTHSGEEDGILNSITTSSTPQNHLALKLILNCLRVKTDSEYSLAEQELATETARTRKQRKAYAQLDFRFHDQDGNPVDDYVFKLGAIVNGEKKPSNTVVHTHKNIITPNHFIAFLCLEKLEPQYEYFIELDSDSGSYLFSFQPDPLVVSAPPNTITNIITADQTTQIDVILYREPRRSLFTFYPGTDPDLHLSWDRKGGKDETKKPWK